MHVALVARRIVDAGILWSLCSIAACYSPLTPNGIEATEASTDASTTGTDVTPMSTGDSGCTDDMMCDDDNVCTDDTCEAGTCAHTPADLPQCSCASVDDCTALPPDDDCRVRSCDGGACTLVFTEAGTPLNPALQTTGDCQQLACDGAGASESVDETSDVPVDGLECTDDVCNGGTPSNPPRTSGASCAAGSCDGEGACVGCQDADDCGGTPSFCQVIVCDGGVCGVENTAADTPLPADEQDAGDCQELRCDGRGNAVPAVDDEDVPDDDGSSCTIEVCNGGVPSTVDADADTACDGDSVCDGAGACVECNSAAHCAPPGNCLVASCDDHACVVDTADAGTMCDDGFFCTADDTCNAAGICIGAGDPCPGADGDADCSEACDEAADACSGNDSSGAVCSDGLFCTSTDRCNGTGSCVGSGNPCPGGDGDADCSETCNELADACSGNDPGGSACDDGSFCTSVDTCNGAGQCTGAGNPCPGPDGDVDCSESCNEASNACTAVDFNGAGCTGNLGQPGTCLNGVCQVGGF